MRSCPRCTYPLHGVQHASVVIDYCWRCGGAFLDAGEMGATYGASSDPSRWTAEMLARPPSPSPLFCPAGHRHLTCFVIAYGGESVEVDGCEACHGLWLDAWEAPKLAAISQMAHGEREVEGQKPGIILYLIQLATMIPVEVWNPVKRKPYLVYGLVAALTVIFGLELQVLGGLAGADASGALLRSLGLTPTLFLRGENTAGLLTHAFLHGGLAHLAGNLYFLWIFGDNVEDRLGRARFAALYLGAAVAGALAHLAGNVWSDQVMVGASGAISGLMGAYLVLFPKVRVWMVILFFRLKLRVGWYFAIWIGMQLMLIFVETNVAWLAHIGGFAAGVALAFAFRGYEQPAPVAVAAAQPAAPRRAA